VSTDWPAAREQFGSTSAGVTASTEKGIEMSEPITIDRAIWTGLAVVSGPVALLLGGPGYAVFHLVGNGPLVAVAIVGGFVLAWLWWSLTVPR
jgi:hypothetical protein